MTKKNMIQPQKPVVCAWCKKKDMPMYYTVTKSKEQFCDTCCKIFYPKEYEAIKKAEKREPLIKSIKMVQLSELQTDK